jgi:hypothetical protein
MTVHIAATVPAPGKSRYEFTDAATGFHVITVECGPAGSPRDTAVQRSGFTGPMRCSHLSDYHPLPAWTLPDYETFMEESGARG